MEKMCVCIILKKQWLSLINYLSAAVYLGSVGNSEAKTSRLIFTLLKQCIYSDLLVVFCGCMNAAECIYNANPGKCVFDYFCDIT